MKDYFRNLDRIEFVMTKACTGSCKHCSEGGNRSGGAKIDGDIASGLIRELCAVYKINSLMTFGGEPLLCPEALLKIHKTAAQAGIQRRTIITNGFFTKDESRIACMAKALAENGAPEILLSVDAFHQETIDIRYPLFFAVQLLKNGLSVKTQPAWLVSETDDNPYNLKTRNILHRFSEIGLSCGSGNVIFPQGNAIKYLGEYFEEGKEYSNPYEEDPEDIHTISVDADGSVLGGNINEKDILQILKEYRA